MVNKNIKVEFRQNYKDLYFKIQRVLIFWKYRDMPPLCTAMREEQILRHSKLSPYELVIENGRIRE